MKYDVIWSKFASDQLEEIHVYYVKMAGKKIANRIARNIVKISLNLQKYPRMGQVEPLLINRNKEYRYLVKGNYKIVYYIESDMNQVRIADIFHTKQNPDKIKREK